MRSARNSRHVAEDSIDAVVENQRRPIHGHSLNVHWPALVTRKPSTHNPIDEPDGEDAERHPCHQNADTKSEDDEQDTETHPEQPEPERSDLPAEMRLEPRPARFAPLQIIQDDRDDRRPA